MDLSEFPSRPFRRHPWEEARFRFLYEVLHAAGLDGAAARLLDVGAGDAWFASQLVQRMPAGTEITCWDPGYAGGVPYATPAGVRFVSTPPEGRFDILLLLDVLEHVEEDRPFLARLVAESLRPGAAVLVTVPAWPSLFGRHDVMLKHFRRYRPAECARLLELAGLEVVDRGGLFHTPLLARATAEVLDRVRRPETTRTETLQWRHGAFAARLVSAGLAFDTRMSSWFSRLGVDVPGLSWWARCRKPS